LSGWCGSSCTTCQRLYLLRAGRIVASGLPAQVLTPERLREVFMVEAIVGQHPATGALQLAFVPWPPQPAED